MARCGPAPPVAPSEPLPKAMDTISNMTLPYRSAATTVRGMAKKQATQVVTANRTADGVPVYLTGDLRWVSELTDAAVHPDKVTAERVLSQIAGQERLICDPYLMPVALQDGTTQPTSARERIRNEGPTSRVRRPDPMLAALAG